MFLAEKLSLRFLNAKFLQDHKSTYKMYIICTQAINEFVSGTSPQHSVNIQYATSNRPIFQIACKECDFPRQ